MVIGSNYYTTRPLNMDVYLMTDVVLMGKERWNDLGTWRQEYTSDGWPSRSSDNESENHNNRLALFLLVRYFSFRLVWH
jgi:hypothetical protein